MTPTAELVAAEVTKVPDAALECPMDARVPTIHVFDDGGSVFPHELSVLWRRRLRDKEKGEETAQPCPFIYAGVSRRGSATSYA
jgi:hypothetical protein